MYNKSLNVYLQHYLIRAEMLHCNVFTNTIINNGIISRMEAGHRYYCAFNYRNGGRYSPYSSIYYRKAWWFA